MSPVSERQPPGVCHGLSFLPSCLFRGTQTLAAISNRSGEGR